MIIELDNSEIGHGKFDSTGKFSCKCGSTKFIKLAKETTFGILFSCLSCGYAYDGRGIQCTRGGTEEPIYPVILLIEGIHDASLFEKY